MRGIYRLSLAVVILGALAGLAGAQGAVTGHSIDLSMGVRSYQGRNELISPLRIRQLSFSFALTYCYTGQIARHEVTASASLGPARHEGAQIEGVEIKQYIFDVGYTCEHSLYRAPGCGIDLWGGITLNVHGVLTEAMEIYYLGPKSLGMNIAGEVPLGSSSRISMRLSTPLLNLTSRSPWSIYDADVLSAASDGRYGRLVLGGEWGSAGAFRGVDLDLSLCREFSAQWSAAVRYRFRFYDLPAGEPIRAVIQDCRLGVQYRFAGRTEE